MFSSVGLLSSQKESFEHHEELSKLSKESEVFCVRVSTRSSKRKDSSNDELCAKHLVVTFREIGYSLFLDSVRCDPDRNDGTKIFVSGKMIVDGICVEFIGSFPKFDSFDEQIHGVGRIRLDENYFRKLSSENSVPTFQPSRSVRSPRRNSKRQTSTNDALLQAGNFSSFSFADPTDEKLPLKKRRFKSQSASNYFHIENEQFSD